MIKLRKTISTIAPRRIVTVGGAAEVWKARPGQMKATTEPLNRPDLGS